MGCENESIVLPPKLQIQHDSARAVQKMTHIFLWTKLKVCDRRPTASVKRNYAPPIQWAVCWTGSLFDVPSFNLNRFGPLDPSEFHSTFQSFQSFYGSICFEGLQIGFQLSVVSQRHQLVGQTKNIR